jgi:5,5'-dehydrodivanillate O-demethylase
VFFAHPQEPLPSVPMMSCDETSYGMVAYADYDDGSRDITHYHMPNMNQVGAQGRHMNIQWRVPIDDEHFRRFGIGDLPLSTVSTTENQGSLGDLLGPNATVKQLGDAILRGDLTVDEIIDLPHAVAIEDYVITVGQGPIAARTAETLGREDTAVIFLRRIWARELESFAQRNPPTRWQRPGPLSVYEPAPRSKEPVGVVS